MLLFDKLYFKSSGHVETIKPGSIGKQSAKTMIKIGYAVPLSWVYRGLKKAIKEDIELLKICVNEARKRGWKIY